MLPRGLYGIADSQFGDPFSMAGELFSYGCSLIQIRAKDWGVDRLITRGREPVSTLCASGCTIIINDHIDVAKALGASGVHLGQEDGCPLAARERLGAHAIVGLSTHDLAQVHAAPDVDYLGFGPVFSTRTKASAGAPRGPTMLQRAVNCTSIPIYAIGGITSSDIAALRNTGVHGWAVASAFHDFADLKDAVTTLSLAAVSKSKVTP